MRHLKSGRKLNITSSHRRAMFRNMTISALIHQRVQTTLAKAKELRRPLEKMITLGKRGDLNARRKALSFVHNKQAIANLFGELAQRYRGRHGGFVRILRLAARRGDGAPMALVVLVDGPKDPYAGGNRVASVGKGVQTKNPAKKPAVSSAPKNDARAKNKPS